MREKSGRAGSLQQPLILSVTVVILGPSASLTLASSALGSVAPALLLFTPGLTQDDVYGCLFVRPCQARPLLCLARVFLAVVEMSVCGCRCVLKT